MYCIASYRESTDPHVPSRSHSQVVSLLRCVLQVRRVSEDDLADEMQAQVEKLHRNFMRGALGSSRASPASQNSKKLMDNLSRLTESTVEAMSEAHNQTMNWQQKVATFLAPKQQRLGGGDVELTARLDQIRRHVISNKKQQFERAIARYCRAQEEADDAPTIEDIRETMLDLMRVLKKEDDAEREQQTDQLAQRVAKHAVAELLRASNGSAERHSEPRGRAKPSASVETGLQPLFYSQTGHHSTDSSASEDVEIAPADCNGTSNAGKGSPMNPVQHAQKLLGKVKDGISGPLATAMRVSPRPRLEWKTV